jgi:hypothetical protein
LADALLSARRAVCQVLQPACVLRKNKIVKKCDAFFFGGKKNTLLKLFFVALAYSVFKSVFFCGVVLISIRYLLVKSNAIPMIAVKVITTDIIMFGCIFLNIAGKFLGGSMQSGQVLVSGKSNAGTNIPQNKIGASPANHVTRIEFLST